MANPVTANVLLEVPLRGSEVGTWDVPVNGDFTGIDGLFGGVVTIGLTNAPVTLTKPAAVPSPGPGPFQSQNRVLRFTGTLSADVQVTLPLPGSYIIENLTLGAFVVSFRAVGSGEIIATPQGSRLTIYNDGTNVRFADLGKPGQKEMWAGISAIPAWVTACTVKPYLLCDGSTFAIATYPWLGAICGSKFGGDGVTTSATPDTRGRVSLPYDGTGTRITTAGSGLNGQTLGAVLDQQAVTLTRANLPNTSVTVQIADPGHTHTYITLGGGGFNLGTAGGAVLQSTTTGSSVTGITAAFNLNGNVTQTTVNNVQPSIVVGIEVIKT